LIADKNIGKDELFLSVDKQSQERQVQAVVVSSIHQVTDRAMSASRQFAIVTGASTGIGLELAKCCAQNNFDLLIAADEPQIEAAGGQHTGPGRCR
jgi:hypothetical protein